MPTSPRTRRRCRAALVVLAGGALALGPAIAPAGAADSTIGSVFTPGPNNCAGNTVFQTATADGLYRIPAAGVITSWRFQPGTVTGTQVALKVGRFSTPTTGVVTGSSETVAVTSAALVQAKTRIPAAAGDVIGLFGDGYCAIASTATDQYTFTSGNPATGAAVASSALTGYRLDISATLEPDADGDGFGDTTQDLCPTRATTQKECVAPVTSVAAKAGKAKRKANGKYKKAKVTVSFVVNETSTSTCSVDGAAAKACTSPLVLKAKKGTHAVTVTSTDAAGNVGTPATTVVKVKKAKAKKK